MGSPAPPLARARRVAPAVMRTKLLRPVAAGMRSGSSPESASATTTNATAETTAGGSAAEPGVGVLQRIGAVREAQHLARLVEVEQVDLVDLDHLAAGLAHRGLEVDESDDQ